jgi:hypothetical protein
MLKPLSDAPISFGHLVRTLARHVDRAMALRVTEHGLTIAEYYVLRELYIEDGLIQRELSSRLNLTEPAMLLTVRGMYEKKLVRRVRDASAAARSRACSQRFGARGAQRRPNRAFSRHTRSHVEQLSTIWRVITWLIHSRALRS